MTDELWNMVVAKFCHRYAIERKSLKESEYFHIAREQYLSGASDRVTYQLLRKAMQETSGVS